MNEGGNTARSDLFGGAGWVLFGFLIASEALRMDRFTSMGAVLYTMPGFVPGILGGVIALLGAILMLRGWQRRQATPAGDKQAIEPAAEPPMNRRVSTTLVLALIYAGGLIGRVPFWLATALFVATFTWVFTPAEQAPAKRLLAATLSGVVTAAIVTLVFQYVFLVRLP